MYSKKRIVILDFGGQYAHLIASRVRKFEVFSEIVNTDTPASALADSAGIILSGGPQSVFDPNSPQIDSAIFGLGIPVLAICYGHQLMCQVLGGKVVEGEIGEYGRAELSVEKETDLFRNVKSKSTVWMSHRDEVTILPAGFSVTASTSTCGKAAVADEKRHLYGVQFHPEVVHSEEGLKMLQNFVAITGAAGSWKLESFIENSIAEINRKVADRKVFLLVSGGVDSTVAFALLEKALGKERVFGLFIDTGLLRKGERDQVKTALAAAGFTNLQVADASDEFLGALAGLTDPEAKRRVIGQTFLEIQKQAVRDYNLNPDEWLLGQGTIYPDTIESGGTKHADKIKTHHNRVPEIEALIEKGLVIEPLSELYKDEVRAVGEALGLAHSLVWRHPFPGPGLGVRILCTDGAEERVENATASEERIAAMAKCEASILPLKSVGVQGDARTYRHPAVLFTASQEWKELVSFSTAITNTERTVNRVILALSDKGKAPFHLKKATITKDRVALLQEADAIVREELEKADLMKSVWQFPVVLAPVSRNGQSESIILRPVWSQEAMTAEAASLPWSVVDRIVERIFALSGIDEVFYDLTNKPPATIEWE